MKPKIKVVRFLKPFPTYGTSSIKVGQANIIEMELVENGQFLLVKRVGNQQFLHPMVVIEAIEIEPAPEAPASRKSSKE